MLFITDKNLPKGKFPLQCWGKVELKNNMRSKWTEQNEISFRKDYFDVVLLVLFWFGLVCYVLFCFVFPDTMLSSYFSSSDFRRVFLVPEQVKFYCVFALVLILQADIDQLINAKGLRCNLQRFYFVLFISYTLVMTLESV